MHRPTNDKKKTLWIVLASLVGAALFAVVGWGYVVGWTVDAQPSDVRRGVDGQHIAELYAEPTLAEGSLEVVRTRYIDGSADVAVDFQNDSVVTSSLYSIERSTSDAISVYGGLLVTGPLVELSTDVELQDRPDLFEWGDNSNSKVLLVDGDPAGHVLTARKGTVAFVVTIAGIYEDDAQRLQALIQPMLDSAMRDG